MKITLEQGIAIAQIVETAIIPAGYHCALGGSVLHKGGSDKDLDIFLYPHNGNSLNPELLRVRLQTHGFKLVNTFGRSKNSHDSKEIEIWEFLKDGTRIDFFFLK